MKMRFLCIGAVMVAILIVVSAGCTTSRTGSSASPGTEAQVSAINTPKTPGQPDYVPSATPSITTSPTLETLSLQVAQKGDAVSVYYSGAFENGTVFDSNMDGTTPVAFTLGNSSVIQGFDDAVTGMSVNQEKTVLIPYDKAYGAYNPALVHTVDRIGPIAGVEFIEGEDYSINDQTTGRYSVVKILHVTPTTVTWDANNPLAGQNLRFTIKLAKITRP